MTPQTGPDVAAKFRQESPVSQLLEADGGHVAHQRVVDALAACPRAGLRLCLTPRNLLSDRDSLE